MRALMAVVLAVAVLWGGYWFVGARSVERGAEAWFAGAAAQGLVAERDSLAVRGFPNRFDLTVNGVKIADPARGFGWQAPFAQVFSLSYKPWHLIAALPNEQVITTPYGDVELASTKLQGSLVLVPNTDLALDRLAMVGEALRATFQGGVVTADQARFATRQAGSAAMHDIGLEVTGLAPDPALLAPLTAQVDLPAVLDLLRLDATATLSAPLDRHAGQARPRLLTLDVTEGVLRWGDMGLFAKGTVTADAAGLAEGRIELRLDNWRKALALAVAAGLIKPEVAPTWERGLELLSATAAQPGTLDLPLTFAKGRMSLGPLPLGPAPRLN